MVSGHRAGPAGGPRGLVRTPGIRAHLPEGLIAHEPLHAPLPDQLIVSRCHHHCVTAGKSAGHLRA
jgi:hypothetical protein